MSLYLDERSEAVLVQPAPSLDKKLGALPRDPYLGRKTPNSSSILMCLWMTSLDWRRGHGTAAAMSAALCFMP